MGGNLIAENLKAIAQRNVFAEKILICPAFTTGHQILENLTRENKGFSWINFKVVTVHALAQELAQEHIYRHGLKILSSLEAGFLVDGIFSELARKGKLKYFEKLIINNGIIRAIAEDLSELKYAKLTPEMLEDGFFINPAKANDIRLLFKNYQQSLQERGLADSADIINIAIKNLGQVSRSKQLSPKEGSLHSALLPGQSGIEINAGSFKTAYIAFERYEYRKIEKEFLYLYCKEDLFVLGQGKVYGLPEPKKRLEPTISSNTPPNKASFLFAPSGVATEKMSDAQDGPNFEIFCAKNYQDEVYSVFEKLAEKRHSADQAEIIYTDTITYPDIIYDLCCKTGIKAAFTGGLAGGKSVAGKALAGFLSWINNDFAEIDLRNLFKYGFIKTGHKAGLKFAGILRELKIGWQRERYRNVFIKKKAEIEEKIKNCHAEPLKVSIYKKELEEISALENIVTELLKIVPLTDGRTIEMESLCSCCMDFLSDFLRLSGSPDTYAYEISYINELKYNLETLKSVKTGSISLEEAVEKITWLINRIRFKREGPKPSALLVSGIENCGVSGRQNIFILGMDDQKFPPAQFQDPILLDEERAKISYDMHLSRDSLKEKLYDFASMLAGLGNNRTNIYMSYSVFDIKDERALSPSSVLLQLFRIMEARPDADYAQLMSYLKNQPKKGMAPPENIAIDHNTFWTKMLLSKDKLIDAKPSLYRIYPWLKSGKIALESRSKDYLTVYDGWLGNPDSYTDRLESLDPRKNKDFVLSCTSIETYAQNPYAFFLERILKIKRPEEIKRDNSIWLDAKTRGSLLHDVFERFLKMFQGGKPGAISEYTDIESKKKLIHKILDDVIGKYKEDIPFPGMSVLMREINELKKDVEVFVEENEKLGIPYLLEYQFGYGGSPQEKIDIGWGAAVNIAGRVDRVDMSGQNPNFFYVWDYKTGSSYGYEDKGYVNMGKQMQHVLYSKVVEKLLKQKNPEFMVIRCGYLFPTLRGRNAGRGCIIERDPHQDEKWQEALNLIISLIASGVFIISEDETPFYLDDEDIYGTEKDKKNIKKKIENLQNIVLEPYRKLKVFK